MLYRTNQELPAEIRDRLPEAVQDLYRAAYNSTVQWYGDAPKAHKAALTAVKIYSARNLVTSV